MSLLQGPQEAASICSEVDFLSRGCPGDPLSSSFPASPPCRTRRSHLPRSVAECCEPSLSDLLLWRNGHGAGMKGSRGKRRGRGRCLQDSDEGFPAMSPWCRPALRGLGSKDAEPMIASILGPSQLPAAAWLLPESQGLLTWSAWPQGGSSCSFTPPPHLG